MVIDLMLLLSTLFLYTSSLVVKTWLLDVGVPTHQCQDREGDTF